VLDSDGETDFSLLVWTNFLFMEKSEPPCPDAPSIAIAGYGVYPGGEELGSVAIVRNMIANGDTR